MKQEGMCGAGTRMAWALRTAPSLPLPCPLPATSLPPPSLMQFSCANRGSWIYVKSAPTGVGGGPCARMPYESPAAGGDHLSPICCPCSQPPNRAGSWESGRGPQPSLPFLPCPPEVSGLGLLTFVLSGCPGWDHPRCYRPQQGQLLGSGTAMGPSESRSVPSVWELWDKHFMHGEASSFLPIWLGMRQGPAI